MNNNNLNYTQHSAIYFYNDTYGLLSVKDCSIIPISFCPWAGEAVFVKDGKYPFHDCNDVDDSVVSNKIAYAGNTKQFIINHPHLNNDNDDDNGTTPSKYTKDELLEKVYARWNEWRSQHTKYGMCIAMHEQIFFRKHYTYLSQIPTIRAYILCRKGKRAGFDFLDYCPFCGAKLPPRLDNILTNILKEEYGLTSWKDYKKAPEEFHTDRWWKDRGLSCYNENNDINVDLEKAYGCSNGRYMKYGISSVS